MIACTGTANRRWISECVSALKRHVVVQGRKLGRSGVIVGEEVCDTCRQDPYHLKTGAKSMLAVPKLVGVLVQHQDNGLC